MDENSSYKNSLVNKVHKTKAAYEMALFNYERISIKDPNWEKQIDAFNLAKLNYETAKSRLEGLKKVKQVQDTCSLSINHSNKTKKQDIS